MKPTARIFSPRTIAIFERPLVLGICLILFLTLASVKVLNVQQMRGDTAIFSQLTENIASGRGPVSQVLANTLAFQGSHLLKVPAEIVATDPLAPPPEREHNMLRFHEYLILYPLALFARFMPAIVVLEGAYVLSFIGLILMAYLALRKKHVPIGASALFCILVISHPAWSGSLLWGQFYPDRIFVFAGFLFITIATQKYPNRIALLGAALFCLLINERAALIAGISLGAYVVLYWKTIDTDRALRLAVAGVLILYSLLITKLWLENATYSQFLPTNLLEIGREWHSATFVGDAGIFLLMSAPLLTIAFFEWRVALIAAIALLPNIFGNIGGAEKVGWITAYHTYYLPILVWAAALGYEVAYRKAAGQKRVTLLLGSTTAIILLVNMVNPNSIPEFSISPRNALASFPVQASQQIATYLRPGGNALLLSAHKMSALVPKGTTVTTVEAGMPMVYRGRTIRFFPIGIESADYAIMAVVQSKSGPQYSGAISFMGPSETSKLNRLILERMKHDGYDFAHAQTFPEFDLAVIRRRH